MKSTKTCCFYVPLGDGQKVRIVPHYKHVGTLQTSTGYLGPEAGARAASCRTVHRLLGRQLLSNDDYPQHLRKLALHSEPSAEPEPELAVDPESKPEAAPFSYDLVLEEPEPEVL